MVSTRILCTDLAGLRAQALGLAEAAGLEPDVSVLTPKAPWNRLSPRLWVRPKWAVGPAILSGAPDVALGAGGAGARVAAAMRTRQTKAVAVQHPRMDLRAFDVILAARHDGISGDNVIITRTALHRVTPARLAQARAHWGPVFAHLRRPLVAVLLGGANGRYSFDGAAALELGIMLDAMAKASGAGLMLTGSRRTAPATMQILRDVLAAHDPFVWDGGGDNPYFGMLACADAIIVTADSVSMVSEAVATAAPVFLVRLAGHSRRIGMFMDMLVADGRARDFAGRLELWDAAPLDDTARAGAELRDRLRL
jgi:mitochondrial fission protein ELM1